MKFTPQQFIAVKEALVSGLEKHGETGPSDVVESPELDEALRRFFSEEHEDASLEEFVERLCRHLS